MLVNQITIAKMFVLRVEMYKLCSAIYRTTLFTTLTSTLTLYFIQYIVRWPIRVIHAQKVKSPHNIMKHANKWAIHATISRFTPQFHDSRHNSTIHATISRFTPQFHDSRHNFTIHATISRFTPQRSRFTPQRNR